MNQYSEDPSQKVCPSLKQLREKYRVEIKKQANEDIFNSKRLKFSENFQAEQLNTYKILPYDPNIINEIFEAFNKNDGNLLLMKIKLVRLNFSMEPINFEELTQTKLAKILINICLSSEFSEFEELIFECSWIILNGLSGDSTIVREFIELGVIDVLKKQINSENVLLREQALWAFSNISGDIDHEIKKLLFKDGVVELICSVSTTFPITEEFKKNLSWFIINLTNDDKLFNFKDTEIFLNVISFLITTDIEDANIIKELMHATYYILLSAQENNDYLAEIVDIYFSLINTIMKEIIPKYKNHKIILFHSIKVLGLLLSGYDSTVEELINHDIISIYASYLSDNEPRIRKEIMWGLSNIACCQSEITQSLYNTPFLIQSILDRAGNDEDPKVQKEGLMCCSNLCVMANQEQCEILIKKGIMDVIFSFLSEDISVLEAILNGLESILYHGRERQKESNYAENPYGIYLEEKRYIEKLEFILSKNTAPENLMIKIDEIINSYLKNDNI